ncbi:MAG: aspartate-semialdehyde dehydrogenase [Bacteroidia bacterium]|nr:MAG: aspartate-semialdehyde dehydrogenase [Bacteroidia bacterium]
MRIALVGATGVVGESMIQLLEERGFGDCEFFPAASERSVGKRLMFGGREHRVGSLSEAVAWRADVALFSAGGAVSKEWAPRFAEAGTRVVDNSSAWRMEPNIPLVVPEVNPDAVGRDDYIIANPNCSTIQLMLAIAPIERAVGISHMHVSTYQSVTGSGLKGIRQLECEREGRELELAAAYAYRIDQNVVPQCDDFLDNGYTKEEMKLVNETRKILDAPGMMVSATAVRVPVKGGHSEAVSIVCKSPCSPSRVRELLSAQPGLVLQDNPAAREYPMPYYAFGRDEVFVGRIREDLAYPGVGINLWVVADNIRKGAATNAVQIVELLLDRGVL